MNALEKLKLFRLYLIYAEKLGVKDFDTFVEEYDLIEEYLSKAWLLEKKYSYQSFKSEKMQEELDAEYKETITQQNNHLVQELFEQAERQKENLRDFLVNLIERSLRIDGNRILNYYGLNTFHNIRYETMTNEKIQNEDGSTTYLFKTFLSSAYEDVSIKFDMTPDNEVHRIEYIRYYAPSPRSPRDTFRIIVDDVDKEKSTVSIDKYSNENYFDQRYEKKGFWINKSVRTITTKKLEKQKKL